jgi:hypothetical protein
MMKNELLNKAVEGKAFEALFLGIKRYAIKYYDIKTKEDKIKSAFSSVKQNTLN